MSTKETKKEGESKAFVPNPKELDGVPDLSSLIYLEEPHVVHNVKCRYEKDLIYTGISSVLVAVNPYKQLKCYTNERINHYANKAKYEKGLPHVYNVAEQAYRQLIWTGKNQSMVVCGESGAGKTENAKYLMRHLAYTTSTGLYKSSQSGSIAAEGTGGGVQEGDLTSAKIEQQILAANPILESFGNAKTLLNNNSSRFGKFTKLLFQKPEKEGIGGHIVGSAMETYLLEKTRVVFQAKGERNYHVFYQICAGLDEDSLKNLGITEAEDFTFLNQSGCIEIPGMSDEYRFTELVEAMELLGFTKEDQSKIFCTVAAVLHLGNVEFEDDETKTSDACKITEDSDYSVKMAAHLLEIKEDELISRLTKESISIRGNVIMKEYSIEKAESNRDSTAKAIYGSLFDWVVLKINHELFLSKLEAKRDAALAKEREEQKKKEEAERLQKEEEEKLKKLAEAENALKKKSPAKKKKLGNKFAMFENKDNDDTPLPPVRRRRKKKKAAVTTDEEKGGVEDGKKEMTMDDLDNDPNINWIGILDVFGFECFEYNSFEQFCINFTNETLQRYFNYNIMLSEQAEYQREGIFWKPIKLPDNKPTLDLINKRPGGIFAIMDNALQMPKATDATFTQLLFKEHGYHPSLRQMTTNPRAKQKGRQKVRMNGFQIKHYAMPVTYDAKEFLIKNQDRVHEDSVALFCGSNSPIVSKLLVKLKGKKSKKRTLGYVFSRQLKNLMTNLNKTKPYFVRCIKPNLEKKAGMFNDTYVANQLRCGGLIEAIKIIKCGYPTRVAYEAIFARYAPSVFSHDRKKMETVNRRDFCEAILRSFNKNRSHFEMGLTKVFFKGQQEEFLEELMRKGGNNWKVPADLVEKIKKHLIRKRVQRVGAFMKGYARWLVRLRRMRAMKTWARWVRISTIINKTMFSSLRKVRSKIATRNLIGALRTALAVQRLKRVRRSVLFMQRHFRRSKQRSALIAEIASRIKKKRDAQEALAANKAKGLSSDEIVSEVAKQAAKWLSKVVFKNVAENLFDGLSDGVALCQMCENLDEKFEHKTFNNASEGSETAKRNISAAIASMQEHLGINKEALFEVDDLSLLQNPRKVVNAITAVCAWASLNGKLPGVPPFPTVEFEIGEQRISGKDDADISIVLFGENGSLENVDEERKKELIQPGYLDKKREFERKTMEMERERKKRMAEMVERDRKAKEEAERQKKEMEEERKKIQKEREEFLEWKRRKKEEEEEKAKKAEEDKKNQASNKDSSSNGAAASASNAGDDDPEVKLDPSVAQKRQFFSLTLASVLLRFQEHGLLTAAGLTLEDFNSIELLNESEKEQIPWHLWNDWVTKRVRARIDALLSKLAPKKATTTAAATTTVTPAKGGKSRQQPLPPLPAGGGNNTAPSSAPRSTARGGGGGGRRLSGAGRTQSSTTTPPVATVKASRSSSGARKSRRSRGQAKKSIIVSISGPKPPPPKQPPPRNAKRYHRRRGQAGKHPSQNVASERLPARPTAASSPVAANNSMPVAPILREGSGIEEKKECSIQ